jgi:hypothetical protein
MNTLQTYENNLVSELVSLIARGIECWQKAGEIVVRMIDEQHYTIEQIADSSEFLTEDIVSRFEQLGRKQLSPGLLIADYPAAKHLVKLTFSEQERLLNGSVDLLLEGGDTLSVATKNLTPYQCRQVFDRKYIRTLSAQRAWMESEKARASSAPIPEMEYPYTIRAGKILIPQACQLTRRDLKRMLNELED